MTPNFIILTTPQNPGPGAGVPTNFAGLASLTGNSNQIPGRGPSLLMFDGSGSNAEIIPGLAATLNQDFLALHNFGFSHAQVTTAERDALENVPQGTELWNVDTSQLEVYRGAAWQPVTMTYFPAGSTLSGSYQGSIFVNGDATLSGDLEVFGSLFVKGNCYNPQGKNLTVHGTFGVEGVLAFTPDIGVVAGNISVDGDLFTGAVMPSDNSFTASVVSKDPANAVLVINQSVTGHGFYPKPNIQSGVYLTFTSGALDGQQFQMNGAAGGTIILTAGTPDLSTVQVGDTVQIANAPAPGPNVSFLQPNTGDTPTIEIGGNWYCAGFDGSSLATKGQHGCNVIIHGDLIGRYVDRVNHPEMFPFFDLSGDTAYSLLWRGGNSGTLQVDGAIRNMGLFLSGGLSNQSGISAGNGGDLYCNEYTAGDGNFAELIPVLMYGGDCTSPTAGDSAGSGGTVYCRGDFMTDAQLINRGGNRNGSISGGGTGNKPNGGNIYIAGDYISSYGYSNTGGSNNASPCDSDAGDGGLVSILGDCLCFGADSDGGGIGDAASSFNAGHGSNSVYIGGDLILEAQNLSAHGGGHSGTGAAGNGGTIYVQGDFSGEGNLDVGGGPGNGTGAGGSGGSINVQGNAAAGTFTAGCPGGYSSGGNAGTITIGGNAFFRLYPASTGGPANAGDGGAGGGIQIGGDLICGAAFVGGGDASHNGGDAGTINVNGSLTLLEGGYGGMSFTGGNGTSGTGGAGGSMNVIGAAALDDALNFTAGSSTADQGGRGGSALFKGLVTSSHNITANGGASNSGHVAGGAGTIGFVGGASIAGRIQCNDGATGTAPSTAGGVTFGGGAFTIKEIDITNRAQLRLLAGGNTDVILKVSKLTGKNVLTNSAQSTDTANMAAYAGITIFHYDQQGDAWYKHVASKDVTVHTLIDAQTYFITDAWDNVAVNGAVSTQTINMPPNPVPNTKVKLTCLSGGITTLTMTPTAGSSFFPAAPTALAAGAWIEWVYVDLGAKFWIRMGGSI